MQKQRLCTLDFSLSPFFSHLPHQRYGQVRLLNLRPRKNASQHGYVYVNLKNACYQKSWRLELMLVASELLLLNSGPELGKKLLRSAFADVILLNYLLSDTARIRTEVGALRLRKFKVFNLVFMITHTRRRNSDSSLLKPGYCYSAEIPVEQRPFQKRWHSCMVTTLVRNLSARYVSNEN